MSIGSVELLIVGLIGLVTIAIPIATLVLLFLIYDKVRRIEQALDRRE